MVEKRGITLLRLPNIDLSKELGFLEPEVLSFHLLQQDPYAPYLSNTKVHHFIKKALAIGERWAAPFTQNLSLLTLSNQLIREGVQILIQDSPPERPDVRAQYDRKQKRITIYRSSFQQLDSFFRKQGYAVPEEEWILLHLTHELYHHLETKPKNRKTFPLPKVIIRKVGPFRIRRPLLSVREIAAHAFTQKALSLPWSPYLLDLWCEYDQKKLGGIEIQNELTKIQRNYDRFRESITED